MSCDKTEQQHLIRGYLELAGLKSGVRVLVPGQAASEAALHCSVTRQIWQQVLGGYLELAGFKGGVRVLVAGPTASEAALYRAVTKKG